MGAASLLAAVSGSIGDLIGAKDVQRWEKATCPLAIGLLWETFPRVPVVVGTICAMSGIGVGVASISRDHPSHARLALDLSGSPSS